MSAYSNGAALIGQFYGERNREYPLRVPVVSIGRASANSLRIQDERIAAHHVRIAWAEASYVLEVTTDEAPTALNGTGLEAGDHRSLVDGDLISLSDFEFRFVAREGADVLSRLWVVSGVHRGKTFRIETPTASVGRAPDNDVQFPDRSVSRHHCRIHRDSETWWIEDLGSTNGTLMRAGPVSAAIPLRHGDEIAAGFSRFVFQEASKPLMNVNLEPLPPSN